MYRVALASLLLVVVFVQSTSLAAAQEAGVSVVDELSESAPLVCADYDATTAIAAKVVLGTESATAGVPLAFTTTLTNSAEHPVIDASVWATIRPVGQVGTAIYVDEFLVASYLSLMPGDVVPLQAEWTPPYALPAGSYVLEVRLSTPARGGERLLVTAPVVVQNDANVQSATITNLTINDTSVTAAAQHVIQSDRVTVKATLTNSNTAPMPVPVTWSTYAGYDTVEPAVIESMSELVTVPPQGTIDVVYTYTQTAPVTTVLFNALQGDASVRAKVSAVLPTAAKITALGLSQFPLTVDTPVVAYACVAGAETSTNLTQIALELKNQTGDVIDTIDYFGVLSTSVGGYGDAVEVTQLERQVMLTARITQGDVVVAEETVVYNCEAIPGACDDVVLPAAPTPTNQGIIYVVGGVMIALLLVIIFVYFFRQRGGSAHTPLSPPPPNSSVTLGLLFFLILGFTLPSFASAQATCSTPSIMRTTSVACNNAGYTELLDGGIEDAYPGQLSNLSPGTCGVVVQSGRGEILYRYWLWSVPACSATPPEANQAPSAPVINGPTAGITGTSYSFQISATDGNGDQIRYGADFNNDGGIDQWLPSFGYVSSGGSQTLTRQWGSAGSYSFQVVTEDANGARSPFTTHAINVAMPPPAERLAVDVTVNGSNGPLTIAAGAPLVINWSSTAALSCGIAGAGVSNPISTSGSRTVSATVSGSYIVSCWDGSDTMLDSVNVTVTPPLPAVGSCTLGTERVGDSGPTDMWGGSACQPVNDLAPFSAPSCPGGATTGTVVNTSSIISAGFCATRQTQSSQCFGTAYIRECNGTPPPAVPNQPPAAPAISGPTTGTPTTNYTFNFSATDANSDQVRYGVDWDFNGVVDTWLPGSGYVNSGTSQASNRSWSANGTYSFRALTQDAAGAVSGWSTHTITVTTVVASCSWDYESNPNLYPWGGNCDATMPACSSLNPAVSDAGEVVAAGSPERCYLSCPSFQPAVASTNNVLKQFCTGASASCSAPAIVLLPATTADFNAARQSCRDLGYTTRIESGIEDAQLGSVTLPDGTCGVFFADPKGAIQYSYIIFGVPACIATGPIVTTPTLSGTSCQIPLGASTCNGTVTWSVPDWNTNNFYTITRTVRNTTTNTATPVGLSGTNPIGLTNGNNTIELREVLSPAIVTPEMNPQFASIILAAACAPGTTWNGSVCSTIAPPPPLPTPQPNLTAAVGEVTPTPASNPVAGTYNTLTVTALIRNVGGTATGIDVPYNLRLTNTTTGTQSNNPTSQVSQLPTGGTASGAHGFTNVPFGIYEITAEADNTNVISESNESDNIGTRAYTLPPPDPNLTLTLSPGSVVRSGTSATLTWQVNVTYDLSCTLVGPALATVSFNPRVNGINGTAQTGPITATSDYVLTCNEPITSTTFTETVRVETVGTVEEI